MSGRLLTQAAAAFLGLAPELGDGLLGSRLGLTQEGCADLLTTRLEARLGLAGRLQGLVDQALALALGRLDDGIGAGLGVEQAFEGFFHSGIRGKGSGTADIAVWTRWTVRLP